MLHNNFMAACWLRIHLVFCRRDCIGYYMYILQLLLSTLTQLGHRQNVDGVNSNSTLRLIGSCQTSVSIWCIMMHLAA